MHLRDPDLLRDLGLRQAFEEAEVQDHALPLVEHAKPGCEHRAVLGDVVLVLHGADRLERVEILAVLGMPVAGALLLAARNPDAWFPAQRLTLDEALHGYTAGAAYSTGRERDWGTLEVGMRCDATVVDRDLAALEGNDFLGAKVSGTITDGVVRYADGLA